MEQDTYSAIILGDTHFDAAPPEIYHGGWTPRNKADRRDRQCEFARNAEMWAERMPRLVAAAGRPMAECAVIAPRHAPVALLHMGDIIQGDSGDADRLRFLRDGQAACTRGMENLPFLPVCGNHDVRGGGGAAYDDWLGGILSSVSGIRRFGGADYLWTHGPDAFVFADFMRPDPSRLDAMLDAAEGARHLFFVSHGTIAPPDAWGPYWFMLGEPELSRERRALFARLLRRNAIVLCGHLHRTQIRRWERPEGTLVEFCANSVLGKGEDAPEFLLDGPGHLGDYVRSTPPPIGEDYDGSRQTRTAGELLALVDEYRPGLVEYRMWRAAGHYVLCVSEKRIDIDFLPGYNGIVGMTFRLKQG